MIPKRIHYCWFGGNPKPKLAEKCIKSWKKYCPDYEMNEWNEDNFDISSAPLYVRQAYEAKKWAFVTDYVRLKVVYDHGGIYMDTDVELKKNLDPLLEYHAYFGFEDGVHVNTGLGFGAEKGAKILADMMEVYADISFVRPDGKQDTLTCPMRNTDALVQYGMRQDNSKQTLEGDILILPSEYLCPLSYYNGIKRMTSNTVSIHHFATTWQTEEMREKHKKAAWKNKLIEFRYNCCNFPRRVAKCLLREEHYNMLKNLFRE